MPRRLEWNKHKVKKAEKGKMAILELLETTQQTPKIHQTKENVYKTIEGRKCGTDKNEDKQREWSVSTAYS